ncbi:MAG: FliM/FliN family flagellar motor switch protein [Bryobacteraceae bacterium]|nr:FliM/FliN family flagellar motor switch protein [Bryobacteraceae bacterium]
MNHREEYEYYAEIPMDVEAELDRKTMTMTQILDLEAGTVIKLKRSAGENIDLLIGGSLVAFGEIVVLQEMMGIRITDFRAEL